jgi:hypothetical protein
MNRYPPRLLLLLLLLLRLPAPLSATTTTTATPAEAECARRAPQAFPAALRAALCRGTSTRNAKQPGKTLSLSLSPLMCLSPLCF